MVNKYPWSTYLNHIQNQHFGAFFIGWAPDYADPDNYVDPDGKFIWSDGEVVCNFGKKHNGRRLRDIAAEDPNYLQWVAGADFTPEVKELVSKALLGEFLKLP